MTEKLKVVVERSKWLRGDPGSSMLLDEDGMRCCLGFVMHAEGFWDAQLFEKTTPHEVVILPQQGRGSRLTCEITSPSGFLVGESNTGWAHRAMLLNDNPGFTDAKRERLLRAHCKCENSLVQFEFVD